MKASRVGMVIGAVSWVILAGGCLVVWIDASNEITGVQNRAQVAGNAHSMKAHLEDLRDNMEERGYNQDAYYAIVFKNPETSTLQDWITVNNLIQRLDDIEEEPPGSVAYQTAVDDVRGTIRELDLHAFDWWWYRHTPDLFAATLPFTATVGIVGLPWLGGALGAWKDGDA